MKISKIGNPKIPHFGGGKNWQKLKKPRKIQKIRKLFEKFTKIAENNKKSRS